jgi:hypothetical protein
MVAVVAEAACPHQPGKYNTDGSGAEDGSGPTRSPGKYKVGTGSQLQLLHPGNNNSTVRAEDLDQACLLDKKLTARVG